MQWNMDFELSALIILLVVGYLQFFGHYVPIKRNRIFVSIILLEILTILTNLIVKAVLYYQGVVAFAKLRVMIGLLYALQYGVVILAMLYLVAWAGRSLQRERFGYLFLIVPVAIYGEEIIRNFLTHHLYCYDSQYGFLETDAIMLLNGVSVYCMIFGIAFCIMHVRFNSFAKLTIFAGLGLISGVAMFIQTGMQQVVFIDFVIAVVILVIYFVMQNPSDMLDHNTRVLSRNMLDEILSSDIYMGRRFDLVVLALDEFKFVNKTFGVAVGDMMLMQVANYLSTISRRGLVYRYGSDQFVLQLYDGEKELEKAVDLVRERFRHPWITEEVSVMMTTTVCCVCCPEDGNELESIIDVIDYSVLSAKKMGKGNIVYARELDLHSLKKEKAIEKAIENAIEQDTIEVYYQPIFNTEKQCYTSAEALVRLHDDLLGNISPEVFIPIAERNGSIVRLGNVIFEKVCKFIAEHKLDETSIEYIEINVSVVQCMQQGFVDTLNEIMEAYGVKPEQINLEVTETAAVNSLMILQENIERLYQQGISFSLDDYGSGYATISYIHRLPFQIIKLDKGMVWDAFENERAGITLKHTVGMLKELKMYIVAEGVETQEQQSHLSNIGCDYLQGWYYSKAVPETEFAELIRKAS